MLLCGGKLSPLLKMTEYRVSFQYEDPRYRQAIKGGAVRAGSIPYSHHGNINVAFSAAAQLEAERQLDGQGDTLCSAYGVEPEYAAYVVMPFNSKSNPYSPETGDFGREGLSKT